MVLDRIQIHVASTDQKAHFLAFEKLLMLENTCQWGRSRGFYEYLESLPHELHGVNDLLILDQEDVFDSLMDDGEGVGLWN